MNKAFQWVRLKVVRVGAMRVEVMHVMRVEAMNESA